MDVINRTETHDKRMKNACVCLDQDSPRLVQDCISRQNAVDTIRDLCGIVSPISDEILLVDKAEVMTELMLLPSVQPRKGEWIKQHDEGCWWYECSCCGDYPLKSAYGDDQLSDFCPWCGADMRGEEDDRN